MSSRIRFVGAGLTLLAAGLLAFGCARTGEGPSASPISPSAEPAAVAPAGMKSATLNVPGMH
jgi:hypothetical protein